MADIRGPGRARFPQSVRRPGSPCHARDPPPNSGVHNHASTQPGQTTGCLPRSARSPGESYRVSAMRTTGCLLASECDLEDERARSGPLANGLEASGVRSRRDLFLVRRPTAGHPDGSDEPGKKMSGIALCRQCPPQRTPGASVRLGPSEVRNDNPLAVGVELAHADPGQPTIQDVGPVGGRAVSYTHLTLPTNREV